MKYQSEDILYYEIIEMLQQIQDLVFQVVSLVIKQIILTKKILLEEFL
jgi:hypothetical protein